ncbi:hypothetical protein GOV12_03875 [Candidatus Pacearchaeota archaeon]|nr:hypothetical protein [Candidatus Pacearchaeota archaeon]
MIDLNRMSVQGRSEERKPFVLSRVGYFNGDYLEHLHRYSEGFKTLPKIDGLEKYGLFVPETPSLIITSKSIDGKLISPHDSNTVVNIISYSSLENERILREFMQKTGINVPYENKKSPLYRTLMSEVFKQIVEVGPEGMDILSSGFA